MRSKLAPIRKQLVNSWISAAVLKVRWRACRAGVHAGQAGACRMPIPLLMLSDPLLLFSPPAQHCRPSSSSSASQDGRVPQWHSSAWSQMERPCCSSLWTRSAEAQAGPGRQHSRRLLPHARSFLSSKCQRKQLWATADRRWFYGRVQGHHRSKLLHTGYYGTGM